MKKFVVFIIVFSSIFNVYSQYKTFKASVLMNEQTGFNFFTGSDSKYYLTTPKALGSGIYDFSGQYNIKSIWLFSPEKYPIGVATTLGLKITKFRFVNNLYFGVDTPGIFIDNSTNHYYNDFFFSRHGSKLVTGKLFVPIMLYLPVHKWFNSNKDNFGIFAGAFYDGYLFAYHKLYYDQNGQLEKNKTKNKYIKQYFNKNGFGLRGGLKIMNIFIYGQYLITPIFSDILPIDIHETKIGLYYYFDWSDKIPDIDEFDFDNDDGTDAK